nr:MAG TPA: hypothetical protein [Caudoviricetes sp.]DAT69732.1 MAG TPA: hypothetical protein [Caudoviricetes sp.]
MDAVQFIKKCQRLARENNVNSFVVLTEDSPETLVKNISDWDREHPGKTRQSELLKTFPNIRIDGNEVVEVCPANFERGFRCPHPSCDINYCEDCRTKYWLEEIE